MKTSDSISTLAAALAEAQGALSNPEKNRTVKVQSDKGSYTFAYATLDAILDLIRKPLHDNKLAVIQLPTEIEPGKWRLMSRLLHSSGEWIESEQPIMVGQGRDSNQAFGSALTYARRYALISMFGLAAEEDDDGNAGDGNRSEPVARGKGGSRPAGAKPAGAAPAGTQPAANALQQAEQHAAQKARSEDLYAALVGEGGMITGCKPMVDAFWKSTGALGWPGRVKAMTALHDNVTRVLSALGTHGGQERLIDMAVEIGGNKPDKAHAEQWATAIAAMCPADASHV